MHAHTNLPKCTLQVNLLLRLCPLVPYNLMNFLMGLTATRVEDYAIGCFVGARFVVLHGLDSMPPIEA